MTLVLLLVAAIAVGIAVYAGIALRAWVRFRGTRVVVCPENHHTAAVEVDPSQAAVSALMGSPDLSLRTCSRWPEKEDCGQECLAQIEAAPDETRVTSVFERWSAERACAMCGQPMVIQRHGHQSAVMDLTRPDHPTLEWATIDPTELPERLKTLAPVCWNCHVAESFRRLHPDLVVDRREHVGPAAHM